MYENKKGEGFFHEKLIVLPGQIISALQEHPLTSTLYLTDIGYFPYAKNHFRSRESGCEHSIFLFCVDGKGIIELEGKTIQLEKNQLIIIPAGIPHLYQADLYDPWSLYWMHFSGSASKPMLEWLMQKNTVLELGTSQHSKFLRQFSSIYALLETGYSMDGLIHVTSLLSVLLTSLRHQDLADYQESVGQPKNFTAQSPVSQCTQFMAEHVYETISLDDLIDLTHLSRSYLLHLFKEQTGFSPIDYFIHMKMQKASSLLDTTTLSIKEIAGMTGYTDPYYFSRIFSKTMSLSPIQYRRIKKG